MDMTGMGLTLSMVKGFSYGVRAAAAAVVAR